MVLWNKNGVCATDAKRSIKVVFAIVNMSVTKLISVNPNQNWEAR